MSSVKKKFLVQWLALIFFIASVGVYAYGWLVTPNENYFARSISVRLQDAQEIIQNEINTIKRQLEALPNGPDPMQLPSNPELKKIGASIYVLEGGEMIYWSDAPRLTPKQCLQLDEDLVLFRWTDGYYLAKRKIHQGRSYVSLQLLRHQYPYQNQYLENRYNPYWGIPENYSIAPSTEQGIMIKLNADSNPIFSIVGDPKQNMVAYNWWSFWLFFSSIVVFTYRRFRKKLRRRRPLLIWTVVLLIIRYISITLGFPSIKDFTLFDPMLCAFDHSGITMGNMTLDVFFMMWIGVPWLLYFMRRTVSKKLQGMSFSWGYAIISTLLIQSFFFWILDVTNHFVLDSTFEMVPHKVLNINAYSILAYCVLGNVFFLYLILEYLLAYIYPILKRPYLFAIRILFAFAMLYLNKEDGSLYFGGAILMTGISVLLSFRRFLYKSGVYIIIAVVSMFLVLVVTNKSVKKNQYMSECIGKRLANERDPVVEYRMMQLSNALQLETSLWSDIKAPGNYLFDTLRLRYFSSDAFSPYLISFTICKKKEHLLIEDSKTEVSCSEFFHQRIVEKGERIGQSFFWFLSNQESNTEYLGVIPVNQSSSGDSVFLYVECYRMDNFGKLGYPELLSNQDQDSWKQFDNMGYSYALYRNDWLIRSFGDYVYPRKRIMPKSQIESERFHIQKNGYNHQFFFDNNNRSIVVSYPSMKIIELVFSFAYTFMFLFLVFSLLWMAFGFHRTRQHGIESRMRVLLIVWITVLLIGVSTVAIQLYQGTYKQESWNRSRSKMRSLVSAYHRSFGDIPLKDMDPAVLSNWMVNTSNFILSDINLYAINGDFIGTSRKEVLGRGFIGYKMNPEAYRIMRQSLPQRWVHQEKIGKLEFVSIYAPLVNQQGKLLGYANISHFADRGEMNRSLTEVIASFVNIYVLFLLLTLPLSKLIAYTVSMPLIRLREKMARFQLSRKPEPIVYHGDDEFGVLVRAYNRMVMQLNASASRLAASERDAAWREMARQIAHEIKNPLTPMLLSIQHLMRMKVANAPGWEKNLDKVAVTLQEQIEVLAKTASEFSDFAKMQESEYQEVDLRSLLESIIPLYESYHNISLEISIPPKPVLLTANREQLQRVLVNFMNNAVQAIGDNPLGRIQILIDIIGHECRFVVRDNGIGIPPENMGRLFQPYFTTKSAGTGLGLPISKKIIQNFGGEIFFHSESGKGASFGFLMPYAHAQEK